MIEDVTIETEGCVKLLKIGEAVLAIAPLGDSLDELLDRAEPWQREHCSRLGSARRQREWLSWQFLLGRIMGGGEIMACGEIMGDGQIKTSYRQSGVPYIIGSEKFLSVSHCSSHVAVLVSDSPCAVDIERQDRDFSKASSRFLTAAEQGFISQSGLVWGAKETIYKLLEDKTIDMLSGIVVEAINEKKIVARVGGESYNLNHLNLNELNVVFLLKNKQSH